MDCSFVPAVSHIIGDIRDSQQEKYSGQTNIYYWYSKAQKWSPGQTDSQVDARRRKFAKPELAYGLAMGGQTDS